MTKPATKIVFSNNKLTKRIRLGKENYIQVYQIVDGEEIPVSIKPAPKEG